MTSQFDRQFACKLQAIQGVSNAISSCVHIHTAGSPLYGAAYIKRGCQTHQNLTGMDALWLPAPSLGLPGSHTRLGLQSGLQQTALGLQGNALGLQLKAQLSGCDSCCQRAGGGLRRVSCCRCRCDCSAFLLRATILAVSLQTHHSCLTQQGQDAMLTAVHMRTLEGTDKGTDGDKIAPRRVVSSIAASMPWTQLLPHRDFPLCSTLCGL